MKPHLINGEWRASTNAIENRNPSDLDDVIDVFAEGTAEDAAAAIEAAKAAAPGWAISTPQVRHDILLGAAMEIRQRQKEIGWELSREEGKTLSEGVAEVGRAANIFDFFAGEALRLTGDVVPSVRHGIDVDVTREAVGVVGIITPWNFPAAIPAWKLAPALCFGNAVVFKPAELVPHTAWLIVDCLHRAGLPPGVLNLVMGRGSVVGHAMVESPDVGALTFTGSVSVGRQIASEAATKLKRVQLEMGGKNPLVVVGDADLDVAVEAAIDGAFYSTGQRCTASSRLIVTEDVHGRFIERLAERTHQLKVGHALEEATEIGPVASVEQLEQNQRYLDIARQEGGQLRAGGDVLSLPTRGHYMQPALITDATQAMTINREEVFGPVASVIRVRDYDEALHVANDTEFGLCAGICTTSLKHAAHFKRHAQAGMVMVNLPTAGVDYHVPFGGRKGSSYGPREQGAYAREFFTIVKTSYVRP